MSATALDEAAAGTTGGLRGLAGRVVRGIRRPIRSMRAQTTVIIVIAFIVSQLVGILLYAEDRHAALEIAETYDIAERAAGVSVLLRNLPTSWRSEVAQATDSRAFGAWLSDHAALSEGGDTDTERALLDYLHALLPRLVDREIRVRIVQKIPPSVEPPERSPLLPPLAAVQPGALEREGPFLLIAVNHGPDEWLNFIGFITPPTALLPFVLRANLVVAALVVALVAFWLVQRVTAPLARLASAAERLGRDIRTEPLDEEGPTEVAQAARAFNRMQRRLTRLVENRTDLLAAISHDLRTPITQMRLRTELAPAGALRRKNLEALAEMETIILTFLDFARAAHDPEERQRIDLGALVETICVDRSDLGADVEYEGEDGLIIECKRLAIKRAVGNLIDNALHYAGRARVSARRAGRMILLRVDDDGPGIPEDELKAVFMPFYRTDRARGGRSGSVGLGLSITQTIVHDHGGDIRLENRPAGGLRAEIMLPA